jgi:hypothetical protein
MATVRLGSFAGLSVKIWIVIHKKPMSYRFPVVIGQLSSVKAKQSHQASKI